uniref:Uncharacterized protein n=1 Tax=Globisporangium ultimum (strain ATCC 200006 / CBS 805.95 / DAOM BR144) TaxID=431595 RepID=K3WY12_GLOUD
MDESRIIGSAILDKELGAIECNKNQDGYSWKAEALNHSIWIDKDLEALQRVARRRQLVFAANPRIIPIPWKVASSDQAAQQRAITKNPTPPTTGTAIDD